MQNAHELSFARRIALGAVVGALLIGNSFVMAVGPAEMTKEKMHEMHEKAIKDEADEWAKLKTDAEKIEHLRGELLAFMHRSHEMHKHHMDKDGKHEKKAHEKGAHKKAAHKGAHKGAHPRKKPAHKKATGKDAAAKTVVAGMKDPGASASTVVAEVVADHDDDKDEEGDDKD